MCGDDCSARRPGLEDGCDDSVLHRDEPAEADRKGVCGLVRIATVIGELEPGNKEQPVSAARALRLAVELVEICVPAVGVDGGRHRIVGPPRVIGNAEHVESLPAVEVDELAYRQRAVAPRRMSVELAEEERPMRPACRRPGRRSACELQSCHSSSSSSETTTSLDGDCSSAGCGSSC